MDEMLPAGEPAAPAAPATTSATPPTDLRPWLAHYSPGVPATITAPEQPLPWLLDEAARRYGTNVAVSFYGAEMSYVRLSALADRFARALVRLGVRRGDRVSICLPNVPQFPIAFFGALRAGAIVVPTNPLYTPPELAHQLKDAGVKVIVLLDLLAPTLAAVRAETPVEHVVLAGVADYLPAPLAVAYRLRQGIAALRGPRKPKVTTPGAVRFLDLLGTGHDARGFEVFALPEPAAPDDVAVLQYTGGTTGVAKGAMLTHRNLVSNAMQAWAWNEQQTGSRHTSLCIAPFFHVYGLTVGMNMTVLNGSTMVLLPRFTVKDTLKAIERYKPDLFPGVPTMYLALAREVEQHRRDLSSIQVCISGSAPLPLEVQRRFEQVSGAKLVEGYGLTEASPVTHCNPVFGERRIGTIGLPMSSTDSAIIDPETWAFLPPGQQGEIVVRGPQVMRGYWQRPEETAQVLRDGWLRTGDIGVQSEDGYFTIVDRAKDIIIAGGLKVFPREVEEVLYAHPKVLEAAVIGIPDAYRGETVRAYIVPKPGERLTEGELAAYVKDRLAVFKVPKQYVFRESLPKSLIGKVLRRELRLEAQAESAS